MKRGLPAGTRVQMRSRPQLQGVVMPYEPGCSRGAFPVRLDDGIWRKCNASDVIVLTQPNKGDQSRVSGRK